MLTNDDLYEKYGKDIVFLFKGQEPFVEALGAPAGVLLERDDKVLCYECEEWFPQLQYHLRKDHKMKTDDYKEKYGFNRGAPLCSRKISKERSDLAYLQIDKDPTISRKVSIGRAHALQITKKRKFERSNRRMQHANTRNTCPEQIKQRYRMLQLKYGNDVGLNVIRKVDSGIDGWAVRHYGSWNAFKEALGEPIDTSSYAKNTASLIYDLRKYVDEYARKPWDTYTHQALNDFPHSEQPYITRFKTINNALLIAGITGEYKVIDGRPSKLYKVEYAVVNKEYIEQLDTSMRRLATRSDALILSRNKSVELVTDQNPTTDVVDPVTLTNISRKLLGKKIKSESQIEKFNRRLTNIPIKV